MRDKTDCRRARSLLSKAWENRHQADLRCSCNLIATNGSFALNADFICDHRGHNGRMQGIGFLFW